MTQEPSGKFSECTIVRFMWDVAIDAIVFEKSITETQSADKRARRSLSKQWRRSVAVVVERSHAQHQ